MMYFYYSLGGGFPLFLDRVDTYFSLPTFPPWVTLRGGESWIPSCLFQGSLFSCLERGEKEIGEIGGDLDFDLEGGGGGIHSSASEGVKSFMKICVFFPFPTVIHLEREVMFSIVRGVFLGVRGS
jgi:hypothetical protein